MENLFIPGKTVLIVSMVVCLTLLLARVRGLLARPLRPDRARPKRILRLVRREWGIDLDTYVASPLMGVAYAFTLGMAPWEKESTRIHRVSYIRGVLLHVGIFVSLVLLVLSLFVSHLWPPLRVLAIVVTGVGAVAGLSASLWRFIGRIERRLSYPDDYASVIVVSGFVALTFWWLIVPSIQPWWYLLSSLMLLYIPFSKIRHFVYFFFTRFFFGDHFGRRGVLPPAHTRVTVANSQGASE
jgi:hypothetical protein